MYYVIFEFNCAESGKKGHFRSQFSSKEVFDCYIRSFSCDCVRAVFESHSEADAISFLKRDVSFLKKDVSLLSQF